MKLGPDEWSRVFGRLADVLPPNAHRHMMLIGGVAMALGYGSRRTIKDADAIIPQETAKEILAAADTIADEFLLPKGWLNQNALEAGRFFRRSQTTWSSTSRALCLEVPSVEHMLAMKVARFAGETDEEDAKILLKKLRLRYTDVEDVWTVIGGLVPVEQEGGARHNLLALWEDLDESA